MRNQLLDILQHTWYASFFEFLNFYHIKDEAIEIIPDLYGKILDIDPRTHQLTTSPQLTPWLEVGMPVQFLTSPDGSTQSLTNAQLDTNKIYYVNTLWCNDYCTKFTVGTTPTTKDIIEVPYSNFSFTIRHNRSYVVIKDPSFLDLGMKVIFENFPSNTDIVAEAGLSTNSKYYIYELLENNKIRLASSQNASQYIRFNKAWAGRIEIVQDNTFLEAVSPEKDIYFVGQTDEKIRAFNKDFGMDNLGKLWEQLRNLNEYAKGSNVKITSVNEDGEYVSSRIDFVNDDKSFNDQVPLIHKKDITPKIFPMVDFSESLWNITFKMSDATIRRFKDMSVTYDEFRQFDIYTKQIGNHSSVPGLYQYMMEVEFGEDNPKEGQMLFEPTISGTYVPRIIYEFTTRAEPIAWYTGLITGVKPEYIVVSPSTDGLGEQRDEIPDTKSGYLKTEDTSRFYEGMPVRFENPADSAEALLQVGIPRGKIFKIDKIVDCNTFSIVDAADGDPYSFRFADFEFWMEIQDNALEMEHPINDATRNDPNYNSRHIIDYLVPGMKVQFENNPDSAQALAQATLDPKKEYYIKEIISTDEVEVYLDTEKPVLLNENTGDPIEDLLNPKARYPDKSNRSTSPTEKFIRTRFTITDIPNGEALELPFCNFEFTIKHHVHHIFVDDTFWFAYRERQPIQFVNPPAASGLEANKKYYVHSIVDKNRFYVSDEWNGPWIELGHTTARCQARHDTGNGLIFTSYPRREPYTRKNPHRVDINPIPMEGSYTFTFGGITCEISHDSIYGPYYIKDTDYTIGRGKS